MGDIVVQLLKLLLEVVFQVFCFGTAYVILPLITFGKVSVMMPRASAGVRIRQNFMKLPGGKIGILGDAAVLIGFLFWIVVVAVGVWLVTRGH